MTPPVRPIHSADTRGKRYILAGTLIASVYSIIQRTPWAPFPHRADSFVLGLAIGAAIVLVIAMLAGRQKSPTPLIVAFALALTPLFGLEAQSTEEVLVEKVMDDTAIVVRGSGARYRIEKGIGCISLGRYEDRRVTVVSPNVFLGVGSTLHLSDVGQECRIWNSSELRRDDAATPDNGGEVSNRVALAVTAVALGIIYLMSRM